MEETNNSQERKNISSKLKDFFFYFHVAFQDPRPDLEFRSRSNRVGSGSTSELHSHEEVRKLTLSCMSLLGQAGTHESKNRSPRNKGKHVLAF
jgi:hypothetical protein